MLANRSKMNFDGKIPHSKYYRVVLLQTRTKWNVMVKRLVQNISGVIFCEWKLKNQVRLWKVPFNMRPFLLRTGTKSSSTVKRLVQNVTCYYYYGRELNEARRRSVLFENVTVLIFLRMEAKWSSIVYRPVQNVTVLLTLLRTGTKSSSTVKHPVWNVTVMIIAVNLFSRYLPRGPQQVVTHK